MYVRWVLISHDSEEHVSHLSNFTYGALTVLFDGTYWVGIFEKTDEQGYCVAKYIFGKEPKDEDVYNVLLHSYRELRFTQPVPASMLDEQQMSYKRRQREIERLLAEAAFTEKADEAKAVLHVDRERAQQERERAAKAEREAEEEREFQLRQEKRKEKHRGH